MKKLSNRQLKFLLIAGPTAVFMAIYILISVLFVNTTDRHLLTTNREMKRYHVGTYHKVINFLHEKMLFVTDRKPKPHITHSVFSTPDTTQTNVIKPTSQKKY